MKLVEILAKKLSEWPESAVCITQDSGGSIYGWEQAGAEYRKYAWYSPDGEDFGMHDIEIEDHDESSDHKKSVVSQAQWQSERDRQKGGEWKRHRGGKQPVADDVRVEVKLRDGDIQAAKASAFLWNHSDCDVYANIMQYRIISQPQTEEVEVKDTTIGTLSYKVEIDTTEASQAIDDLTAKWDQIETPFKWRDEVTELNAYIEKYTREREALINRLAEEGFALIPAMTPVMGVADVDMGDWRNWKRGDIVEVIIPNDGELPVGGQYTVAEVEHPEYDGGMMVKVFDDEGESHWPEDDKYEGRMVFKFIRRP